MFGGKCHEYFENKQPGIWEDIREYDWAFFIAVTSLILSFLAIIFLVLDLITGKDEDY